MYYYNEAPTDIEDIIMDFLIYRKNKRQPGIGIQSVHEAGNIKEDYKPLEIIQEYLSQEDKAFQRNGITAKALQEASAAIDAVQKSVSAERKLHAELTLETTNNPSETYTPEIKLENPSFSPLSGIKFDNVPDCESEYMRLLYSDTNKRLHSYIDMAINEYEYTGSPAFEDCIQKETIDRMVDKALELASKDIYELNEIKADMHRHNWTPHRVLRACIEALLLNELYYRRRLMFTSVPDFTDKFI